MTRLSALGLILLVGCNETGVSQHEISEATRRLELEARVSRLEWEMNHVEASDEIGWNYAKALGNELDALGNIVDRNAETYNNHIAEYRRHIH